MKKLKNMIFSIIHSTVSKKGFYKNLSSIPSSLQTYCQSLKFGQTEHGSYIVNVLAPHNDISDINNPIQQDITSTVSENINYTLIALSKAIECYKGKNLTKYFLESINSGVSANLCDSIIGMSVKNESYDVEITISSKILHQSLKHEFKSENIKYLKIATEYLKGHTVIENYSVVGKVITLNKQPDEESGSVTIKFEYDKHTKNIKLLLPDADYLEAVKAHANKSTVSINGDLVIDSKKTNLINFGKLNITNQTQLLLQ
ncbi:hypothetical protein [Acinetobacter sp. SH20PTE14]|uniref:hypothetical protein n=1 Tax=Acinetobacter sp. SH20PTE14 TaxID=2905879 RepID=UPI001F2C03CB|nr:hypothetical protein [Acinetobacter sp. SH20PTE14]UIJ74982.1 hypothetical protein LXF01_12210 [Acinetobacter sp. SH20PTE14]